MIIKNDLLFNLESPEEEHYLSGNLIFDCADSSNIPNTPCIVNKANWNRETNNIYVICPFPRYRGLEPNAENLYKRKHIVVDDEPVFVAKNRIVTIEEFDFSKFKSLKEYLRYNDVITFQIWKCPQSMLGYDRKKCFKATGRSVVEFLVGLNDNIKPLYRYNSEEYIGYTSERSSRNDLLHFVTFFNLKRCIPSLNPKRIDGVALIYRAVKEAATKQAGKLHCAAQMAIIFTNYLDNRFVIDGIKLSAPQEINEKHIRDLMKIAEADSIFGGEEKKKSGSKKKPEKEGIKYYATSSNGNYNLNWPSFYTTTAATTTTTSW
jgi:hypothetical protein